jgi:hypothetical protein
VSASEKLKALGHPYPTLANQRHLASALPQIVAVVEAAERYFRAHDRGEQGHRADVRAALAALDEALE